MKPGAAGHDDAHDRLRATSLRSEPYVSASVRRGRLFLSPPDVGRASGELLLDAFDSNWIAPLGPHVDAFEREFADVRRASAHAAALSSGTAALHLALRAARRAARATRCSCRRSRSWRPRTPSLYVGARPVFVDSERATWNIDPALGRRGAGRARPAQGACSRPRVIVVDLYGQCADWDPILAVVRARTASR